MQRRIELTRSESEDGVCLHSPEVGYFTCAVERGSLLSPGAIAGMISKLGETITLIVPRGVTGRVVSERPERVHAPVGFGDVLYVLRPIGDSASEEEPSDAPDTTGVPTFRSPQSGRFWHRPAPTDPPFVAEGTTLEVGTTVGLIEVMKTFTHLAYDPGDELPQSARVTRVLVDDGAEVKQGDGLFEVE